MMTDWFEAQQDADDARDDSDDVFPLERVSDIIHLADTPIKFIIRGFLIDGSHGMLAGEKKTLKSYIGTIMDISIISGLPLFDHFRVERTGPVIVYVGEGGKIPYLRRVKRICKAMELDLKTVLHDYHIVTETAPISSPKFQRSLAAHLAAVRPVLYRMDPLYAYHGSDSDPRNVHSEGELLNIVSQMTGEYGSNALITNHFNKTGRGADLDRITMSGSGEWVDSWILVDKIGGDDGQDVLNGNFRLKLSVGSRQWGEADWQLDLSVGRFDMDLGDHAEDISWKLVRLGLSSADSARPEALSLRREIIQTLIDKPWDLTRTDVKAAIGVKGQKVSTLLRSELKRVGDSQLIIERKFPLPDKNGVKKMQPRLGLNPLHRDVPDDYPLPPPGGVRVVGKP